MKKIIIASTNDGKVKEIKSLLLPLGYYVSGMKDQKFFETIEETGKTFSENALIKAKAACKKYKRIAIADDSGLEVKALNGAPGIFSARYAGVGATDEMNNELLIQNLKNVRDRSARYVCAMCVYFPNDEYIIVEDYCDGKITSKPKGSEGFGYDQYFMCNELEKTMAELTLNEKNFISHRAKCIRKIVSHLNLMR